MEDRRLIEEICDIIAQKAVPQTETYREKVRLASEARKALDSSLSDAQGELLEEWYGLRSECGVEEDLHKFCLIFKFAYDILKS